MAEVIHMNPEEEGNCKFDLLTGDSFKESYEAANIMNVTISITEITPEEAARRGGTSIHVIHSGRRQKIQEKWDEALKDTCGKIVYAEQISVILKEVGGFDIKHCDVVRKAIAKKQDNKVSAYKALFAAAISGGFHEDEIDDKWYQIVNGCQYTFNRSHWLAYHCSNQCRPNCPICEYEKDVPPNASGIRKSV